MINNATLVEMWGKIKSFLLTNSTASQTVAKNAIWLSVAQVGGRMLRAIIIIYAARLLGAAEFGVFNYAITLVAVLTILLDVGISSILTRETAKNQDPVYRKQVLSTSFVIKATLLAFGVFLVLFIAPYLTKIEMAKQLFPIVVWILIFDTLREFCFAYLRAIERMEWEAFLSIVMNVIIVVCGFLFLYLKTNVFSFTYSYVVGTGVGFALTAYTLRNHLTDLRSYFTPSLIKPLIISAWPFAISGVLGMLTINTDVVMIGWLRSADELGYYSAGQRLIQILYIVPSLIAISVLPTFARLARTDDQKFKRIFERIISVIFMVALPIVVGGIILGNDLISLIYGSGYEPGIISFKILLLTLLIDFPIVVLSAAMFAYDRQKNLIVYAGIGGAVNVVLNILLIPYFGIAGCAMATVIAQFLANVYLWSVMKRVNPFRIIPHLSRVFMATILMGIATLALTFAAIHIIGIIAIAIFLYFSLLYVLRDPLILEMQSILRPAVSSVPGHGGSASLAIQEGMHKHIGAD